VFEQFERSHKLKQRDPLTFATCDPNTMSGTRPAYVSSLVGGKWVGGNTAELFEIPDPLQDGHSFIKIGLVTEEGLEPFIQSLRECPKSGLHNPLKNVERYLLYGQLSAKAAQRLAEPEVEHFFARLIQRTSPKSYAQAAGEVQVTQKFLENFSGDQVRFMCRSFGVAGDHAGQQSNGMRWPYGPVAIVTPFNFPLEIPVLQLMGALYMGNKPILKVCEKVECKALVQAPPNSWIASHANAHRSRLSWSSFCA